MCFRSAFLAAPLLVTAILLLLGRAVFADPLPKDTLKQDPRLGKTVSLTAANIYIGELVERLSQQSGVPLAAGEEDGAADVEVTVSLHAVPLADAMDALWSLMSYQNAEWDWERSGKPGAYRYRLVQPEAARGLPALVQKQVQEQFEGEAAKLLAALKMTPDQLKEAAKGDRLLQSLSDGQDPRVRPAMTLFSELPQPIQDSILQQHQSINIPVSALPPAGRDFVHQQWQWTLDHGGKTKDKEGNWIPVPEPTAIVISGYKAPNDMVPWLTLDVGWGSGSYVGSGWMEEDWHKKIALMWIRPGDSADVPASALRVPGPLNAPPEARPTHPLAHHLMQLAQSAPLSLIARLPDDRGSGSNVADMSPYGLTARAYLTRLRDAEIAHKWRNGILLLSHAGRLTQNSENADASWSLVKSLRESEAKGDGYLTLDDLARAAGRSNAAQLHTLAIHFSIMGGVAVWRDLLVDYYDSPSIRPELVSPAGTDWIGALHAAATALGPPAERLVQDGDATHVRIVQTRHEDWKPPSHGIEVQLLSNTGQIKARMGFSYPAHEWRSSLDPAEGTGSPAKN